MNRLYLIDFDGTITSKDSFVEFSFFSTPTFFFIKFWITTFFFFFLIPKSRLKERFFENFKEMDAISFKFICDQFIKKKLIKNIKKSFKDFNEGLDSKSKIVIVSASISNYLKPWCDSMDFELISTELELSLIHI